MLVTFDYRNSRDLTELIEQEINQGDYMGMIFASSMTRQLPEMELSPGSHRPCSTAIWRHQETAIAPPSCLPTSSGGYKMTAHLLAQGCRRIALIQGEPWMEANNLRLEGIARR